MKPLNIKTCLKFFLRLFSKEKSPEESGNKKRTIADEHNWFSGNGKVQLCRQSIASVEWHGRGYQGELSFHIFLYMHDNGKRLDFNEKQQSLFLLLIYRRRNCLVDRYHIHHPVDEGKGA